jgi:hypothetical protein
MKYTILEAQSWDDGDGRRSPSSFFCTYIFENGECWMKYELEVDSSAVLGDLVLDADDFGCKFDRLGGFTEYHHFLKPPLFEQA